MLYDLDQRRAALYLSRANMEIVKAAGSRRQGDTSKIDGKRLPPSIAGPRVSLEVISERAAEGREVRVTPIGYKTARRELPGLMARLPKTDRRRQAVQVLADAVERVGAVAGASWDGGSCAHSGGAPDGGATTRIKHASRLRMIEAYANGWSIERGGRIVRKADRVVAAVQRRTGKRQDIKAFPAILALCVDGASASQILRRHHWPVKSRYQKVIIEGVFAVLDDVAEGLGY